MILDLFRNPGDPEPQPPEVGDIILTARLAKVVVDVRPVESKAWHHRWRITTQNLGARSDPAVADEVLRRRKAGAGLRETGTYGRGESAVDFARNNGALVESG